jgi:hypothetical protein
MIEKVAADGILNETNSGLRINISLSLWDIERMISSATLSVLLLVSISANIVDHMAFAQSQRNTSTTNGVIDNVNLTETLIEEAKDVYANATEAAKQVANKTQETVQAVANRTEEAVQRVVNTTKEAVYETSLFMSNASQIARDDDIRANITEASKSIRTESEDNLRALITETRDVLNNLTESVKQFIGGN